MRLKGKKPLVHYVEREGYIEPTCQGGMVETYISGNWPKDQIIKHKTIETVPVYCLCNGRLRRFICWWIRTH